jgi:hypothetical protein
MMHYCYRAPTNWTMNLRFTRKQDAKEQRESEIYSEKIELRHAILGQHHQVTLN